MDNEAFDIYFNVNGKKIIYWDVFIKRFWFDIEFSLKIWDMHYESK